MQFIVEKRDFCDPAVIFERVRRDGAVFLHSAGGGRYSIIGYDPFWMLRAKDNLVRVEEYFDESAPVSTFFEGDALEILHELLSRHTPRLKRDFLPDIPFFGGVLGFLSYDYGVTFENIKQRVRDDLKVPDAYFVLPRKVIVFDHEKEQVYGISWGVLKEDVEKGLREMKGVLDVDFLSSANLELRKPLKSGVLTRNRVFQALHELMFDSYNKNRERRPKSASFPSVFRRLLASVRQEPRSSIRSNLSKQEYFDKIARIQQYLKDGDTYQVNFSQRFTARIDRDPWEIYKNLTHINPSPFQAYLEIDDFAVISNSPERLVRVYEDADSSMWRRMIVDARPIKGTMPRGKTSEEDEYFRQKLLRSKKDTAELTMIVDLVRNDIGRVCEQGSVKVNENRIVDGYSHVWHTMSNVRGRLQRGKNFIDVLRAVFPGGSITGCPKKRTMEIIDELEEFKRGVYTGSMGYIGFDGRMDFNIMIRTLFLKNKKGYFHAGGGIVMDSKALDEYQETLDKAKALMQGIISDKGHICRKSQRNIPG